MGDVNKLFVSKSKSLLTTPSNVLSLHLKQTFPPIIWIFSEGEGDGIESRLPFKIFSTLMDLQPNDYSSNLMVIVDSLNQVQVHTHSFSTIYPAAFCRHLPYTIYIHTFLGLCIICVGKTMINVPATPKLLEWPSGSACTRKLYTTPCRQ